MGRCSDARGRHAHTLSVCPLYGDIRCFGRGERIVVNDKFEDIQRAHVRKLFTQLDAWIVRRIWSHRCKRWRCSGWKQLPQTKLYGEMGLVSLLALHLRARPPGRGSF